MNNIWKISTPRMIKDEEAIQAQSEKIPEFIRELDSSMKRLGQCWEGTAWQSFHQQVELDIENMMEIYEWMRNYLVAMSQSVKKYGEVEKNCLSAVENLRI